MYQQAIGGFGRLPVLALEPRAPVKDLLRLCLEHLATTALSAEGAAGALVQELGQGRGIGGAVGPRAVRLERSEVEAAAQVRDCLCNPHPCGPRLCGVTFLAGVQGTLPFPHTALLRSSSVASPLSAHGKSSDQESREPLFGRALMP